MPQRRGVQEVIGLFGMGLGMNARQIAEQYIDTKITLGNIITIVVMIFGGGMVYAQIVSYMSENDSRVTRLEQQLRESNLAAGIKDDRSNARFEAFTQRLNDIAVTTARTDERLAYLIQQQRNERRTP
jgi:reverse gyrase